MIKKCLVCGKEFYIRPSTIKIGSGKYCSVKCYCQNRKGKKASKEHRLKISKANQGSKHWNWQGGKRKDTKGYILLYNPKHPFQVHNAVPEHRLIVEKHLGRYLSPEEVVHHINEIRNDNRLENFMVFRNDAIHHKYHNGKYIDPSDIVFNGQN